MLRLLSSLVVLSLAGCSGEPGTSVMLTVDASSPLSVARLHLDATAGGTQRSYDVTPTKGTIPPALTILLRVPPSITGSLMVDVTAFDAADDPLASVSGSAELHPGSVERVSLTLIAPGDDLAVQSSDAGVDMVATDLTTADLTSAPDLAEPALVMLPPSKSYGSLDAGWVSSDTEFTVQNTGTPTTALTSSLTGPNAGEFAIDSDSCTGLALASLDTCKVSVSFHPANAGPRSATLLVSDGVRSGSAPLTGRAVGVNGKACSDPADCLSGNCTDGFCCDKAAASCGGCNACNVSGFEGTCKPIPAGTDPRGTCAAVTCSTKKCDGAGACAAGNAGAVCHQACVDNININSFHCDGASTTCPSTGATSGACPNHFDCDNSGTKLCFTSCTSDSQCQTGSFCDSSNNCVAQLAPGSACNRDRQCQDGAAQCLNNSCTACGQPTQPCCRSQACVGGNCNGTTCVACGHSGQPCCPGGTCNIVSPPSLACSGGNCVACGGVGQPCCAGNVGCSGGCCDLSGTCVANNTTCTAAGGTCSNGSCGSCGAHGQACCSGWCTDVTDSCVSGTCQSVGFEGEPCGQLYNWCWNQGNLTCSAGLCTSTCGGTGQVCCRTNGSDSHAGLNEHCANTIGCPVSNTCP